MKSYFQAFSILLCITALVSCNQQTTLENRLENTEWQLTKKVRTVMTDDLAQSLPSTQAGNYAFDRTKTTDGITVNFHDDGTGNMVMDGTIEAFFWTSEKGEENLQVTIQTTDAKRFEVLIGDRDLQIWESQSQESQSREPFGRRYRIITEKWELKAQ